MLRHMDLRHSAAKGLWPSNQGLWPSNQALWPSNQAPRRRHPLWLPGALLAIGLGLGGCSADFLRFDAPAFNLNGDRSTADTDGDIAPTGSALAARSQAYPAAAGNDDDSTRSYPSVAGVEPSAPPASEPPPVRVASNRQPPERAPNTTYAQPAYTPSTQPASKPYLPATTGALPADQGAITVQPGDTLYQLARRHGVSVQHLREANGLTGNVIKPGQTLVLRGAAPLNPSSRTPPPRRIAAAAPANPARFTEPSNAPSATPGAAPASSRGSYTVRPGDSLYAIARRTGTSVAELKRLNNITDVRAIRPGRTLALAAGPSSGPNSGPSSGPNSGPAPGYASAPPPQSRVAARTDYGGGSTITAKQIKTVPIVRAKAVPDQPGAASITTPRILNQRPDTPIATKPAEKVAALPAVTAETKFRWPARGRVIAAFNHSGTGVKNDGVNIALPEGTEIGAAESGVVAYAGSELKGYGNLVLVRHDNGWVSAYAHASEILVKRGDRITRGQVIAKAGRSGDVTQPQLHFELRKGAKPVDPMPHMAAM